jgi:thermostable 8-oxoguanine DNA glycosylase
MNKELLIKIYNEAYEYLEIIKPKGIDLNDYLYTEKKFKTKKDIMSTLLRSLQNYQRMPNVIGFTNESRSFIFKEILFDYDPHKILSIYKNHEQLLEVFVNRFKLKKVNLLTKNNSWVKYSKATLSAAKFINSFKDADDFESFVNLFSYNETTSSALPMLLSKEIFGLGFALACDFLKELGFDQYPKPDVHVIDIFSSLKLSSNNEYDCYKEVIRMANANNVTPYNVDKVFWLIGSGRFYEHEINIGGHKKVFINNMTNKIENN